MPTDKRMIHCVFVVLFLCSPLAATSHRGESLVKLLWNHGRKELILNYFRNGIEDSPHRRYLLQATTPSPSPSLSPSPSPISSPSPSPSSSPAPTPSQSPLLSPSPTQEIPSPLPFFPVSDLTEPPETSPSPPPPPPPPPVDQSTDKRTIAIAVSLTAIVTFSLAALFFVFCTKICRENPPDRKNDERPLLSLSLSDYSVSSSSKTFANGGSIKEEKLILHDEKPPMRFGHVSSTVAAFESSGTIISNLPYPPGRKPTNSTVESLPPEPPASLKQNSTVQPPPPPAAPAPPKPPPPVMPPRPPAKPPGMAPPRPPPSKSKPPDADTEADAPKTKLKPFFWDKVLANPDHSMVWHQIKSGSFQFNEEMIESLFGAAPTDKGKAEKKKDSGTDGGSQFVQILDPKKAQNLSIMLRALNVTIEEVCDALEEGNELPVEFLQMLLKMAPTQEEELKLRLYSGDPVQLGPAERFLKVLVDTPFAFKRLEALLFMCSLEEEVMSTKESLSTLETACNEVRNCRLFLKILEAVLKTGNRMNVGTFRGDAQAFKLDTLLKLSDVKGTDGKTTLLHFVVQEIVRTEGLKAARAMKENRSVSSVSSKTEDFEDDAEDSPDADSNQLGLREVAKVSVELEHVKKAAAVDADTLSGNVSRLAQWVGKTREFLEKELREEGERGSFCGTLRRFVGNAERDVRALQEEEKRISALVKSTGDYFHGHAGRDEGLRLFVVVRDFLIVLERVCKEVADKLARQAKSLRKETSTASNSSSMGRRAGDRRDVLFPAIARRRAGSASDSDSDSDS